MVSDQLAVGGAERCAAILSQFFERNNCHVHHIIVQDKIEYEYAGEVLNLGKLKNQSNDVFNKLKRFRILRRFFLNNHFDYIIDFRVKWNWMQEFAIAKYIFNAPLIITVHSYLTDFYFPKNSFLANKIFSHSYKIIAVSKKIEVKVLSDFAYSNVETIYNPIDLKCVEREGGKQVSVDYKYILAAGRMQDNIKQFDKLIQCYAKSILPRKDVRLIILGDGLIKNDLIALTEKLNLTEKVVFKGKVSNPFVYYKKALFTVLTSKNEGFGNVLIESLACETPVISFDCPAGPSEIIQNRENGLLVEDQNESKLTEALDELFLNEKLYYHCKSNAKQSVARFDIENVGQQWLKMLK